MSGRTSPIVMSRRRVGAIWRSARLGAAPPMTPSAIHPSMRSRWSGSERRSARTAPSSALLSFISTRVATGAMTRTATAGRAMREPSA